MQVQRRTNIVIIIVAVASVLIVIGAVFYLVTLGFGSGPGPGASPKATYSTTPVMGGLQITVESITYAVAWDDIRMVLNDGGNLTIWDIETADLDGGHRVTGAYAAKPLGTLSVTLNVTDVSGNGKVGAGDSLTIAAFPPFSPATNYAMILQYEPTAENMGVEVRFNG